MNVEQGIEV